MFFDTKTNNHNLQFSPFKSCIVPRPIGWISSVDAQGTVNIAPYSYFNAVSDVPPIIMFASSSKKNGDAKDTIRNIEDTKEFVVNIATYDMKMQMSQSSASLDYGVSEAEQFNIKTSASTLIKTPRIEASPINLECRYVQTVELLVESEHISSKIVFGHVIGINIADYLIVDGKIDIEKLRPIARLGGNQYALIDKFFTLDKAK